MEFVTPPALRSGDTVAIVAPSSGGARNASHVFELGLDRLENVFGLEPVVYPTARASDEFLAANPRARAADIHAAFRDPDVDGVLATIGGWDQLRTLRHLDPAVLREHPTRFYGMSDNTNLNLALFDAVLVGRVPGRSFVEEPPVEQQERYRMEVREAIVEQVGRYNPDAPVVLGLDWGHTTPIAPLPIGGRAVVDPGAERIALSA